MIGNCSIPTRRVFLSRARVRGQAFQSEFRTEPLMGVRFMEQFLHDGRATTVEQAISFHGGQAAASRNAFNALNASDRNAMLTAMRSD